MRNLLELVSFVRTAIFYKTKLLYLWWNEASQLVKKVQRAHFPTSVVVWWGASYEGMTDPYFYDKGIKTGMQPLLRI